MVRRRFSFHDCCEAIQPIEQVKGAVSSKVKRQQVAGSTIDSFSLGFGPLVLVIAT